MKFQSNLEHLFTENCFLTFSKHFDKKKKTIQWENTSFVRIINTALIKSSFKSDLNFERMKFRCEKSLSTETSVTGTQITCIAALRSSGKEWFLSRWKLDIKTLKINLLIWWLTLYSFYSESAIL
jgi:hypothetical protein